MRKAGRGASAGMDPKYKEEGMHHGSAVPWALTIALAFLTCASIKAETVKQVIELRTYHFASPEKQSAFEQFLKGVAIPALNRAGVRPVGVFRMLKADNPDLGLEADSTDLLVLLPFPDVATALSLPGVLDMDKEYQDAGQSILRSTKEDPAYTRYESSLLLSFDGIPTIEVPGLADTRILQLRIYESHNADRALRKIEMFNTGGELALFREVGMDPVFFGQAIAGGKLPNLTYMLSFKDDDSRKAAWDKFMKHPAWIKMKDDPKYKDTVSAITNIFLRPAQGSQI